MLVDHDEKYAIIAAGYGLEPLGIIGRLKDTSVACPLLLAWTLGHLHTVFMFCSVKL
jgi:hypothetical protein